MGFIFTLVEFLSPQSYSILEHQPPHKTVSSCENWGRIAAGVTGWRGTPGGPVPRTPPLLKPGVSRSPILRACLYLTGLWARSLNGPLRRHLSKLTLTLDSSGQHYQLGLRRGYPKQFKGKTED